MTKYATLTILAALTFPALAVAQTAADMDVNGDGVLTLTEVQAAYPEVTSDMFATMDTNADGALDSNEIIAAQDAGLMPA